MTLVRETRKLGSRQTKHGKFPEKGERVRPATKNDGAPVGGNIVGTGDGAGLEVGSSDGIGVVGTGVAVGALVSSFVGNGDGAGLSDG